MTKLKFCETITTIHTIVYCKGAYRRRSVNSICACNIFIFIAIALTFQFQILIEKIVSFFRLAKVYIEILTNRFNHLGHRIYGIWVVGRFIDLPLVPLLYPSRAPLVYLSCNSLAPLVHLSCNSYDLLVPLSCTSYVSLAPVSQVCQN